MSNQICHCCKKEKQPEKTLHITSNTGVDEKLYLCLDCVEEIAANVKN